MLDNMGTFNYLQMRNIFSLIVVKDWRRWYIHRL